MPHTMYSYIVILVALLICGIVLFVNMKAWKRITICCLLVVASLSFHRAVNSFYGNPIILEHSLENAIILGHYADQEHDVIYLWVKDSDYPKTYLVPFTHKLNKILEKKREQSKGKPYNLKLEVKRDGSKPFENIVEEVMPYDIKVLPPKYNK